jgi:hypothetical protein
MDRAGWHRSERLVIPSGIYVEYLPAYSPELQPAERLWSVTDESLVNKSFDKIEIRETEEELKALLRKEKDATRYEKLQVLYWLKTQTVETVLSAAVRLGKHRTTIQRWLSSYRSGGIEELLLQKPRSVRR